MKVAGVVTIFAIAVLTAVYALTPAHRVPPPSYLMVDDFRWQVTMIDSFPMEEVEIWGRTNFKTHVLYIQKNTCIEKEKEVVIHEALHAATGEEFQAASVNGHVAIKVLAVELAHIIQDNPELRRYLAQ